MSISDNKNQVNKDFPDDLEYLTLGIGNKEDGTTGEV